PVKVNGANIGDADRRKYETEFLRRAQEREKRGGDLPAESALPRDADSVIRQARQRQFISSAYFLRFKFEEGTYALVGHEMLDGRDVLRIEYYPAKLFLHHQRVAQADRSDPRKAWAAELERMMNKVSVVTLWIDPSMHQ